MQILIFSKLKKVCDASGGAQLKGCLAQIKSNLSTPKYTTNSLISICRLYFAKQPQATDVHFITNMSEKELIKACKANDRNAQKALYNRYAPEMLALCRRYVGKMDDAEDVMVEGFFKVFTKINTYTGEGSFEGWIKRIMINEALMFLRKNNPLKFSEEISDGVPQVEFPSIESELTAEQIIALLDELPPGYRAVFNLFVIEGFKHREIAQKLGISINTSKSQLILAKARMAQLVQQRLGIQPPAK